MAIDRAISSSQIYAVSDDKAISSLGNIALAAAYSQRHRAGNAGGLFTSTIDGHGATASPGGYGAHIAQNHIGFCQARAFYIDSKAVLRAIILTAHQIKSAKIEGIPCHNAYIFHILGSSKTDIGSINRPIALQQRARRGADSYRALLC